MNFVSQPALLRHAAAALAAAGCAFLAACGSNPTQLHVDDHSRPIVSGRGVVRLGEGPGGPGIEVEASQVRARGEQMLTNVETGTLGGQSILGPVTLQHQAKVQHFQFTYNHLLFAGRPVEMEWFAGAAWVHTQWDSQSLRAGDPALSARNTWYGPTGGVLARVRLAPLLALEARYEGAINVSGSVDSGDRNAAELALALRPAPGLVLRGGYAEYRSWLRKEFTDSELSVRARGPFLNLGLEF